MRPFDDGASHYNCIFDLSALFYRYTGEQDRMLDMSCDPAAVRHHGVFHNAGIQNSVTGFPTVSTVDFPVILK